MAIDRPIGSNTRFTLQQITPIEWIVVDGLCGLNDPRRTVACIYEVDEFECDVIWLRDLGLPSTYASPIEVLDDIRDTADRRTRVASQKPIPIPHRPPQTAWAAS